MTPEQIKKILKGYKKPFSYNRGTQFITDHNDNDVLAIRGWRHLQYVEEGFEIQDNLGTLIAEFLNKLEA